MKQPSNSPKRSNSGQRSAQDIRTERLKAALKANLARRKAQARKRRTEDCENGAGSSS
ncbi:hypothetical protein N9X60_03200 [Paracoccaceae bacterium]|nr:hypothetical protein [Paracoccaceae bacterium]